MAALILVISLFAGIFLGNHIPSVTQYFGSGGITLDSTATVATPVSVANGGWGNDGTATTSRPNGGLSVGGGGLASSQGITITGGDFVSTGKLNITGTASSTLAGGLTAAGLSSSAGLSVTTGDLVLAGKLNITGTATSVNAGDELLSGGFKANDLVVVDQSSFGGRLEVTGAATSSFAGGIRVAGLASTQGLAVTGGDAIFVGKIVVQGVASSSFTSAVDSMSDIGINGVFSSINTGTSSLEGSLDIDRNLEVSRSVIAGFASTTSNDINCALANYQEIIIDRDTTVKMNGCAAGQTLSLGIYPVPGGDFQIDWDGPSASSSLYWADAVASTTGGVGYLSQGRYNLCSFRFATTSNFAFASCSIDFSPR